MKLARMEFSLGGALLVVIVGSLILCGALVHFAWWQTANSTNRNILAYAEDQVAESARVAWWKRVEDVQTLSDALRVAIDHAQESAPLEPLLAGLTLSHKLPDTVAIVDIADQTLLLHGRETDRIFVWRQDRAGNVIATNGYTGSGQIDRDWPAPSLPGLARPTHPDFAAVKEPRWIMVENGAGDSERFVIYAQQSRRGLLLVGFSFERFSALLSTIAVGKSGHVLVVAPDGKRVVAGISRAGTRPGLEEIAQAIGAFVVARPAKALNTPEKRSLTVGEEVYAIGLTPLWFRGWQLAVVIPESDFLSDIGRMLRNVTIGIAVFVGLAGLLVAAAAQRWIVRPIEHIVRDIRHVEQFALDQISYRDTNLRELNSVSGAITQMAAGLADFAKFIPTELVRGLLRDGMRAEPGGKRREITVLFADLAGFTQLTEELGDDIVPIISHFLDLSTRIITRHEGTVDKYIGDAVMAFWGAPNSDPDHALKACRAAREIADAFAELAARDERFSALNVRIGLQSGPAIVGNIGSVQRLNYTALGDTVNLASRIEGLNKAFGTGILLGAGTRLAADGHIVSREIDTVTAYGRKGDIVVHELLAIADNAPAENWVMHYEAALQCYRDRRFSEAITLLERLVSERPDDQPGQRLLARCKELSANPPPEDWRPVLHIGIK